MTRGTRQERLVWTALEAIAYQTRDVTEVVVADTVDDPTLRVDSGAVRNDVSRQSRADIAQMPAVRLRVDETTALGATYAAGLVVDYWATVDDLRANWRLGRRVEPEMAADEANRRDAQWCDAVKRARGWTRGGVPVTQRQRAQTALPPRRWRPLFRPITGPVNGPVGADAVRPNSTHSVVRRCRQSEPPNDRVGHNHGLCSV